MATYFHGSNSEIQSSGDGLQTLYLMNPSYVPYSDSTAAQHQHPTTPNMVLFNPNTAGNALNLANFSHAPPQSPNQQHLIGVTIPPNIIGSNNSEDPARPSLIAHAGHHEISGFHGFPTASAPRVHYNLWGSMIDQTGSGAASASTSSGAATTGDVSQQMGFRRPSQQGLSLSLSSQQTAYRSLSGELDVPGHARVLAISPSSRGGGSGGDGMRVLGNSPSSVSNGISSMQGVIFGSKYLKAAQELLDEVVHVGKGISKADSMEGANKEKMEANKESSPGIGEGSSGGGHQNNGRHGAELSTTQRQELQMKKSKLVSMLDEVEQRYRQYHHQMQIVISSFEQAAGYGTAKSYTSLALKTISKQFRCLKDAITSQIRATNKTLGEEDCLGAKIEGSRLRYVDHHLRQQRALQQLGMIQHNAWRTQRGLPERAVSILRAWLFEHFLHPYPKDSDKVMLAKQTGLTRSQVSNWFINARVRLWKPMVEEMYMEEVKEQEQNGSQDNNGNNSKEPHKELGSSTNAPQESGSGPIRLDQIKSFQSKPESVSHQNASPTEISNSSMSTMGGSLQSQTGFHLAGSSIDMQRNPNKPRNSEMQNSASSILSMNMEMKPGETNRSEVTTNFGIERHRKDGYPLINGNTNQQGSGGYGAFSMEDIGRFNVSEQLAPRFHGNGVSLTLGLPHSENHPLSGTQHGFLSPNIHLGRRLEMGSNGTDFCAINNPPSSHSGTGYESIDIQNRKRFAAQLLPDFVT
ncbi:hypothetical protein L6164_022170 [Bauhinia variegata]|uniref:Uncharacterized protein n=1 Tax=Bauhinia variegata TaxID=167791 RepID=A0ACB9MES7_BAUVA|nr:hypothetical protein L6164_022170 [Bauhinia variegata]